MEITGGTNGELITPLSKINCSSLDNTYYTSVYLKLDHQFLPNSNGAGDIAEVQVSTDGVNWNTILRLSDKTGANQGVIHLNLSKFAAGQKFQIRFRLSSADVGTTWNINKVEVRSSKYSTVYHQ